jgi:uncharacterized protein (DUF488 family)
MQTEKSHDVHPVVLTIGHSTHPIDAFIGMLEKNKASHVLDVRTVPRSRRNPQYDQSLLPQSLEDEGIRYTHLPKLGGLRHARADSINKGWRNLSFRGYADYMQTPEFEAGLRQVLELVNREKDGRCVLMCAEAVPWRCHRSLVADALLVRGIRVEHIIHSNERKLHVMTPWAQTDGLKIFYPAPPGAEAEDGDNKIT